MKHALRPLTHILAMKDWNAAKRKWIGTICQAVRYEDGTKGIIVLDVMSAKTEQALDDELHLSMVLRPLAQGGRTAMGRLHQRAGAPRAVIHTCSALWAATRQHSRDDAPLP